MWKRRAAVILCVLLSHALILYSLLRFTATENLRAGSQEFITEPILLFLEELAKPEPAETPAGTEARAPTRSQIPQDSPPARSPVPGESGAITLPPNRVDWPIEGKKSAARVLAAEAEAERIAKMFAGPGGTWASLTKRQRSKINKFRFKPGIDGLEKDSDGNIIYRLSEGCVVVNSAFIGCAIGKAKIHDDMFENMRLYFDEQRLPRTDEGNGTEPESRRP
jgi:hypothetical protein